MLRTNVVFVVWISRHKDFRDIICEGDMATNHQKESSPDDVASVSVHVLCPFGSCTLLFEAMWTLKVTPSPHQHRRRTQTESETTSSGELFDVIWICCPHHC